MKTKFSRILGVGLSLALLTSLLLTAAPISANVSQPTVDVDPEEISLAGKYVINFTVNNDLTASDDTITVRFPADTDVPEGPLGTLGTDYKIAASPGWVSGVWVTTTFDPTGITATGDEDDRTVILDLVCGNDAQRIGETATVRIEFATTANIVNPTDPGTYTLEVKTSDETTYVASESYDIDAPIVGGFVYVYNPSNILMATFGGSSALNDAGTTTDYYGKEGFTIKVGPGTYTLTGDVTISGKGVTLESSGGAADTIIDGNGKSIIIDYVDATHTGEDVVIDGFTIDDALVGVQIDADDATVQNCVITDATTAGVQIDAAGTDATVADNVIEDCAIGVNFVVMDEVDLGDVDITGNEITETSGSGGIVFGGGNQDIDITGNTITGNDNSGIYFADNDTYTTATDICSDITISGNTISENGEDGIEIAEPDADTQAPTKLVIKQNDIMDNDDDGVVAATWDDASDYIMFNNISGNDGDSVVNSDTDDDINARFNWWGTTDDDDFDETGNVDVEPWLSGVSTDIVSGLKVSAGDTNVTSLDGKDDVGVRVSNMSDDDGDGAEIISAFTYAANPEDAIDAIMFTDIFVLLDTGTGAGVVDIDEVEAKLKFYDTAITSGSTVYFWTGDFWAKCSDQDPQAGVIYVTVSEDTTPALDELEATPFAVVAGEEEEDKLAAPTILAPETGASDVSLAPTLAWSAVEDADGYYLILADNPNFVMPMVKLDGDMARLVVTAYTYVTELPYSTPYYWRVKAVSGTVDAGTLMESGWVSSVFITMAEPEEAIPPVVIEEQPAAPAPIIKPIVEVVTPPAEQITPLWIYIVIGVGAVLVIAVIVLIVRTRRVA